MIEIIEGLPDGVVGIEGVGKVTADDYKLVAAPAVEDALSRHTKINLIHVLGDRFEGYTAGGQLDDAKLALMHVRQLNRIAVVTDSDLWRTLTKSAGWTVPGEMRLFSNAEQAEAIAWASEDGREVGEHNE